MYGVAYSPNGDFLASGTIGGIINVWSLKVRRRYYRCCGGLSTHEICFFYLSTGWHIGEDVPSEW